MFSIVDGNEEHIPVIAEIAEITWRITYAKILSVDQLEYMLHSLYGPVELAKVMREGSQKFLLIKDETKFQAFASFGMRPEDPNIFKLHKIYVLPESHGKGYGTVLIEEIKRRLERQGIKILDLNVNRYNPARVFYSKLGFEIVREEDVPIGPYFMNDYVMRLHF
jgi:GNAT superfamily N-acetyltransferase